MNIGVIIPAAGSSARFGTKDKLAEDIGGRPLLLRTVEFFTKREEVLEIVVAGPVDTFHEFQDRYGPALSFHGVKIIQGGKEGRWESVRNALGHISSNVDRVVIHDGARPALFNNLFDTLLLASNKFHAVAVALQINGTVKRVADTPTTIGDEDSIADSILGTSTQASVDAYTVIETIDRSALWELQTPQIFEPSLLRRAYEQDDLSSCTDDAQVIEKLGEPVHVIEGDSRNIKVTTPADIALIRSILHVQGEQERPAHKRF
jgi:2-C-methyl-D-erythritol 4-phosphate cytidylyltransferase